MVPGGQHPHLGCLCLPGAAKPDPHWGWTVSICLLKDKGNQGNRKGKENSARGCRTPPGWSPGDGPTDKIRHQGHHPPSSTVILISSKAAVATCEHPSRLDLLKFPHRLRGRGKSSDPHQSLRLSIPTSYIQFCPRCTWTWDTCVHRMNTVWKSNWRGSSSMQLWGSHPYGDFPEVIVLVI